MAAVVVWVGEVKTALYLTVAKKYTIYMARSGKRGLEMVQRHGAALVVLDAASMKTSGQRILEQFTRAFPETSLMLIGTPTHPLSNVIVVAPEAKPRSFIMQVNRLLGATRSTTLTYGGVRLDVSGQRLLFSNAQVVLSPKQCRLLEVLFKHGGEVVSRALLMREVWDTDYLGDTRTLDVHIRWVRNKLESMAGLHHLQLMTIRGTGYRLEVIYT